MMARRDFSLRRAEFGALLRGDTAPAYQRDETVRLDKVASSAHNRGATVRLVSRSARHMTPPPARPYDQRFIDAAPGVRLWADATGDREATPLLLIMGANASGLAWPDALVARLAERH